MMYSLKQCIFVLILGATTNGKVDYIYFKRTSDYVKIYTDSGTGAWRDASIWRPHDPENGYYPVGDVAERSHNKPQISSILVKDVGDGLVAPPDDFSEIWNDRGSGGSQDVRVMKMNPPNGYKCIGAVAVIGYKNMPNRNNYRCVKSLYTIKGSYDLVWKDKGSGASRDVGLWRHRRSGGDTNGVESNTFDAFATHNNPSGSPTILNGKYVKSHLDLKNDNKNMAIILYKTTDLNLIWKDSGSGGKYDFSIWRSNGPSGTYSLGDIGMKGYGKPSSGFVAKEIKSDALRPPVDFRMSWKDRWSGASWDGSFWEPLCPSGYRALGYVSMRNYNKPSTSQMRCVKAEYTVPGKWEWVWNDKGSGASWDCSAYRAVPNGNNGQRIEGTSTVRSHGKMNRDPFVLKSSAVHFTDGKPVERYIITDVLYHLENKNTVLREPESLAYSTVENKGDTVQTITRTISYSFKESYTFSSTRGLEVGVSATFKAGLPLVAESEVTVSASTSISTTWGSDISTTKSDSIRAQITVEPRSQKTAVVTGNRYKMDIPYTATLKTVYMDGTSGTNTNFKGVFKGVQVHEVRVVLEKDVPL